MPQRDATNLRNARKMSGSWINFCQLFVIKVYNIIWAALVIWVQGMPRVPTW